MRAKTLIVVAVLACAPAGASARHSSSRTTTGFATSRCVSLACYSKYPGGTWRHPVTERMGRSHRSRSNSYPGT